MRASRSILWLGLLAAMPAMAQQNLSHVSNDITTQAGTKYGKLNTVSGDIHVVGGSSAGSLHSVSGDITVDADATIGRAATTSGNLKIADGVRATGLETVSGKLTLGRRVEVDGDVASISGDIFVDRGGKLSGTITSISGNIGLVQTELKGDINFVSSNVTVGVGSHVSGRLKLKKPTFSTLSRTPRVVIGPNAVVEGPLEFGLPVKLYVHDTARIGPVTGATAVAFSTATPPKD